MLPERWLRFHVREGRIVPHFLGADDHPWLRALLEEYRSLAGDPRRTLEERLREPLRDRSLEGRRRMASHVLDRLCRDRRVAAVDPRLVRAAVFLAAARLDDREEALASAATELGVAAGRLVDDLFADLPGERRVEPPPAELSPGELALRTNLALAQGLLFRAARVEIEAYGNARVLVRHAKLRGLLCTVRPRAGESDAVLVLSGPFSIFRRTLLYGKALASLVPLLSWCARFRLRADCDLGGERALFELFSADPIFPGSEPRPFDSRVEERFARDFRRIAPDWEIVREPEPVEAEGTLVFPDFALQHRHDPARRWLLEIVGFWTPEYLTAKLARLRAAGIPNLILAIDEELDCSGEALPPNAAVVRYRRRVDARAVARRIQGFTG